MNNVLKYDRLISCYNSSLTLSHTLYTHTLSATHSLSHTVSPSHSLSLSPSHSLSLSLTHRYVDLSEAIDSGDASFLDNTEYHETDAVPLNATLPTAHYLVDEVKFDFKMSK